MEFQVKGENALSQRDPRMAMECFDKAEHELTVLQPSRSEHHPAHVKAPAPPMSIGAAA
jgi:hypothetical protein